MKLMATTLGQVFWSLVNKLSGRGNFSHSSPEVVQPTPTPVVTLETKIDPTLALQFDFQSLVVRIQELEKAIYHIAASQREQLDQERLRDELLVEIATNLEEIIHVFEENSGSSEEDEAAAEAAETEEVIDEAWEPKKTLSSLN